MKISKKEITEVFQEWEEGISAHPKGYMSRDSEVTIKEWASMQAEYFLELLEVVRGKFDPNN